MMSSTSKCGGAEVLEPCMPREKPCRLHTDVSCWYASASIPHIFLSHIALINQCLENCRIG
jgi:hypothetical protein